MVVEDNDVSRGLMTYLLESRGYIARFESFAARLEHGRGLRPMAQ